SWELLAQPCQLRQRIVVALLAVEEQYQRETRVGLVFAAVGGSLLDEPHAAFPVAAEAGHIGDPPQRKRKRRDDVAVCADDESGVLALGRKREHRLMFLVR